MAHPPTYASIPRELALELQRAMIRPVEVRREDSIVGFPILKWPLGRHPSRATSGHRTRVVKAAAWQVLLVVLALGGCADDPAKTSRATASGQEPTRLVFPKSAQVDDPSVNEVVRAMMTACIENDYARFRALWSATEQPLKRRQFDRRWQPIRRITIRKVQPMRHADDQRLLYYVHAGFEFGAGAREPKREVVFLMVWQNDAWRLGRAPKSLVKQVLDKNIRDAD